MAMYTFDQARIISQANPVSVYCHESNPVGFWYQGAASTICIFEMSDGSVFTYRGSWCSEGFPTTWESDWRVIGERGSILWSGADEIKCQIVDDAAHPEFIRTYIDIPVSVPERGREGHWGLH